MTLNRRQFLEAAFALGITLPSAVRGSSVPTFSGHQSLNGRILALTTLAPENPALEQSSLLAFNLETGVQSIHALPDYRFGHSIEALPGNRWLVVPYGDDDVSCLVLDAQFNIQHRIAAPSGYGFGGHAAVLPGGRALVHFNRGRYPLRSESDTGQLAVIDTKRGSVVYTAPSPILHGHDIILSQDQKRVIVGDDGTVESGTDPEPFILEARRPALHVYDAGDFSLIRTIPLNINGSLVHIAETIEGQVVGAVEQYVTRNEGGRQVLRQLLGDQLAKEYEAGFDPIDFAAELPLPGPLVSVELQNNQQTKHQSINHQDPFDVCVNQLTGVIVHVFTQSNMLASKAPGSDWTYHETADYGVVEPFGLTNIHGTPYMAVNGFRSGIGIFDTTTMQRMSQMETTNHGIKHLTHDPKRST